MAFLIKEILLWMSLLQYFGNYSLHYQAESKNFSIQGSIKETNKKKMPNETYISENSHQNFFSYFSTKICNQWTYLLLW